jgi:hypothetical protein
MIKIMSQELAEVAAKIADAPRHRPHVRLPPQRGAIDIADDRGCLSIAVKRAVAAVAEPATSIRSHQIAV